MNQPTEPTDDGRSPVLTVVDPAYPCPPDPGRRAAEPAAEQPAIVRFVRDWQRGWVPGTPGRLSIHDVQQIGLASARARTRYPGPVGELIVREIWAYTEFGHRFDSTGAVPRIVAELLADPVSGSAVGS